MRRKLIKTIIASGMIVGGTLLVAPGVSAVRQEERVRVWQNQIDDVMITKIVPGKPRIELTYNDTNPIYSANGSWPRRVEIAYGDFSDWDMYMVNGAFDGYIFRKKNAMRVASFQAEDYTSTNKWKDGETIVLNGRPFVYINADLVNASEGRLVYKVTFTNGEKLLGRVDYTRCLNSSAFWNGIATECRMEEIGDGKVQYQPYTSDGVRVEIPSEEDVILTAATENWVPEYGWPDLEPEPEPVEPEPEPEPEPVEPEPEPEPEPVEPEPEPEPETVEPEPEPKPVEPEPSKTEDAKVILAGVKEQNGSDDSVDTKEEHEIVMTVVNEAKNDTKETSTTESLHSESTHDESAIQDNTSVGITDSTMNSATDSVTSQGILAEKTKTDDVEVPELGQKTDKKPNIALSIVLIAGAGAALIVAWWFLLFGKHKSKERKEGKE